MAHSSERKADILVADDSLPNLRLIVEILGNKGYTVRPVLDGASALESIRAQPPDLILLDVNMPKINGYDVCQQLKFDDSTCDIPVIFISASEQLINKVTAFFVGGVDYITKPYQPEEVLARVKTHLSLHFLQQRLKSQNLLLQEEIAARKQVEAALTQANSDLESFAYSVSHDLRTPLRHINGFIELLLKDEAQHVSERARQYLDTIAAASARMGQLINSILTLSRAGRAALVVMPIDLNALLKEVIQEASPGPKTRQIHWKIEELPMVQADLNLLKQVFVNLVANAIKFTSNCDNARIHIGLLKNTDEQSSGSDRVSIFIRDNGVGFDPAYTHKLFNSFQRLHSEQEFQGIGIGLAIVKRIITRHGGKVWAEGEVGKGATFYVTLEKAPPP